MKVVECWGGPRELGRQSGEALREEIAENLANERRPNPDVWARRLPVFLETTRRYLPDVLEEMEGLAEGADIAAEDVYRFNFPLWNNELDTEGCTNLVFAGGPDGPVWGKNNDGLRATPLKRSAVRYVKPTSGIPQVVVGHAGRVGSTDGMNAEGLAVGHSSVGSVFQQSDQHPFIRLWEYVVRFRCATVPEFVRCMTELPLHGKGFSIVCVDRSGAVASLEAACPLMQVRQPDRETGIHCVNCFQLSSLSNADRRTPHAKADAQSRATYMNRVLDGEGPYDVGHMKRVLRNHADQAICRHSSESCEHETEWSVIGLPAEGRILYCSGRPCAGDYLAIDL